VRAVLASFAFGFAVGISACATVPPPAHQRPPRAPIIQADVLPDWGRQRREVAKPKAKVSVAGIEGTLASFDVKITMEKLGREFGACHEPRARRVPMLAGSLEFEIHVQHSGEVSQVELRTSDVGDRELERCFLDVVRAAHFPRPNGGDANVTYTMLLGPAGKGREPEQWEPGRVQHVVSKRGADVSEQCELPSGAAFSITAYVNARGRVVTAGVTAGSTAQPEHFDCIAKAMRSLSMPKPTKKRFAKVTFPLNATS
jgi:hypothetical protein